MPQKSLALESALKSSEFLECNSSVRKMLYILSVVYSHDESSFVKLVRLKRGSLKLISNNQIEILRSASDPRPRSIPNTPYWIATKTSTVSKRKTLKEALEILGYESKVVSIVDSFFV
jgi:negative modulator of initiation of replication